MFYALSEHPGLEATCFFIPSTMLSPKNCLPLLRRCQVVFKLSLVLLNAKGTMWQTSGLAVPVTIHAWLSRMRHGREDFSVSCRGQAKLQEKTYLQLGVQQPGKSGARWIHDAGLRKVSKRPDPGWGEMYSTYPGGTRLIARGQLQVWHGFEVGKERVISGFVGLRSR